MSDDPDRDDLALASFGVAPLARRVWGGGG